MAAGYVDKEAYNGTGNKPTGGFIGIGVMGKSMAGHLLAAGYPLVVYNRTKAKAEALLEQGASWAECPGAVAKACDVVITMVGYPKDVEETYLGENGLIAKGRQGALFIDMTTSSPALARRIAVAAKNAGMAALDAPVSGGDVGAREARLAARQAEGLGETVRRRDDSAGARSGTRANQDRATLCLCPRRSTVEW